MSDHLGNVLATVLDRKTGAGTAGGGTLYDHWGADIASATDYYPGGMPMPNRKVENNWYRFGGQGSQKDDEIYGKGNSIDMGDRHLDTRILHTFKPDLLAAQYPSISPYTYAAGNPIFYTDPDGKVIHVYGEAQNDYISKLQAGTTMTVNYDIEANQVTFTGEPITCTDILLLQASQDANINVRMYATFAQGVRKPDGGSQAIIVGLFGGSEIGADGKVNTTQFVNPQHMEQLETDGLSTSGEDATHELMESYEGAKIGPGDPGTDFTSEKSVFRAAHAKVLETADLKDDLKQYDDFTLSGNIGMVKNGTKLSIFYNRKSSDLTFTSKASETRNSQKIAKEAKANYQRFLDSFAPAKEKAPKVELPKLDYSCTITGEE